MAFGDLFPQFVVDRGKLRGLLRDPPIEFARDALLFQQETRFV